MLKVSVIPAWLSRFEIVRTFGVPLSGGPDFDIARMESDLAAELLERQKLDRKKLSASDGLKPPTWLRVTCYQLIQILYARQREDELFQRIEDHKRLRTGTPNQDRDLFKDGLVGLFAAHPGIIPDGDRNRMVDPMWYGFRHYIPPALLTGFNNQYPGHKGRSSDWRTDIEPALVGWVQEQRIYSMTRQCNLDQHRGIYPEAIRHVTDEAIELISDEKIESPMRPSHPTFEEDDW